MRRKCAAFILLIMTMATLLSGCYDAMEIDDEVYVIAMGVDIGTSNKVRITIQYPNYKSGGGGNDSGQSDGKGGSQNPNMQEGSIVHTIEAPTVLEGIDMLSMAISRRVSFIHTKILVFSEGFAKQGIGSYMGGFERFRETRATMSVLVVKGKAEDFLKANQSNIGESVSKSVELLLAQSSLASFFPRVKFYDVYKDMLAPNTQPIALYGGVNDFSSLDGNEGGQSPLVTGKGFLPGELPRSGVAKREIAGVAVFNGDKMVGSLNSYETKYYLMITGQYRRGKISIADRHSPDNAIIFDVHNNGKPQVKAYFKDGKPVIDLVVDLKTEIYAIQSRIEYEKPSLEEDMRSQIKDFLLTGVKNTIQKTQQELHADIFRFGDKMAGNFMTIEEWETYNWLSHYPDATVNVDVQVKIRRTGLIFTSASIYYNTGKKEEEFDR